MSHSFNDEPDREDFPENDSQLSGDGDVTDGEPQSDSQIIDFLSEVRSECFRPLPANFTPRYQNPKLIGQGGMGMVFRVYDRKLKRAIALKTLRSDLLDDVDYLDQFLYERELLSRLSVPGVPHVLDYDESDDFRPFFCMDLVSGPTFGEVLRTEAFDQCFDYFLKFAKTLSLVHRQGVLHLDLKPDNLMVTEYGELQVMDWGLATDISSPRKPSSEASPEAGCDVDRSRVVGTFAYMAPEQVKRENIGYPTDVFSMGAILVELLTGLPVYVATTHEQMRKMVEDCDTRAALERLEATESEPGLIELAVDSLSANPSDRPNDAGEFYSRLTAVVAAIQQNHRTTELKLATMETEFQSYRQSRKARFQRLLLSISLLTLFLLSLAGWVWMERGKRITETSLKNQAIDLKVRAIKNENEAKRNEKLAQHNLEHAQQIYGEAVDAIQQIYGLLDNRQLNYSKQFQEIKKDVFELGVGIFTNYDKQFTSAAFENQKYLVRHRMAKLNLQLGDSKSEQIELEELAKELEALGDGQAPEIYQVLFEVFVDIANGNLDQNRPDLFQQNLEKALVYARLSPDAKLNEASVREALGMGLFSAGKLPEAETQLFLAVACIKEIPEYQEEPDLIFRYADVINKLGAIKSEIGQNKAEVESLLLQSLKLVSPVRNLTTAGLRVVSEIHNSLGKFYESEDPLKAKRHYQLAVDLREDSLTFGDDENLNDLAMDLNNLATLSSRDDASAAKFEYQRGIKVQERVVQRRPESTRFNSTMALLLCNLADIHGREHEPEQALGLLQRARGFVNVDSKSVEARSIYARILRMEGIEHRVLEDFSTARAKYQEAIQVFKGLAQDLPGPKYLQELAMAYFNACVVEIKENDFVEALRLCQNAIECWNKCDSLDEGNQSNFEKANRLLKLIENKTKL